VNPPGNITVLRKRGELAAFALECADLALHCAERAQLDRPRSKGTRCVLVWTADALGGRRLGALVPFAAPAFYRGLPLLALKSCAPLLRAGCEHAALHALLEWFRSDGEGAALLVFGSLRRCGPVYRAFAEVARQREQLVLAATAADGSRTLLVSDRKWNELNTATLPLLRWAKRSTASLVYGGLDL
jgi:hypothetical protein